MSQYSVEGSGWGHGYKKHSFAAGPVQVGGLVKRAHLVCSYYTLRSLYSYINTFMLPLFHLLLQCCIKKESLLLLFPNVKINVVVSAVFVFLLERKVGA